MLFLCVRILYSLVTVNEFVSGLRGRVVGVWKNVYWEPLLFDSEGLRFEVKSCEESEVCELSLH